MEKKSKLGSLVSGAGKAAKGLFDKTKELAVKVADQNDDGKFDMADVSAVAGSIGDAVKKNIQTHKENAERRAQEKEMAELRPIFASMPGQTDFSVPKFFRVVERDKRYTESTLCEGAIGFYSGDKDAPCVNLFEDSLSNYGICFDTVAENDCYFRNPTDSAHYIGINTYFDFMKTARVMELIQIAQDLGAKKFEIKSYYEDKNASEKGIKAAVKVMSAGSAHMESDVSQAHRKALEIEASNTFPGGDPVQPQLRYLASEPFVLKLISLRMNPASPLQEQRFRLRMSDSIGITEKEAAGIDTVTSGAKISTNMSMTKRLHNETQHFLEYYIEF